MNTNLDHSEKNELKISVKKGKTKKNRAACSHFLSWPQSSDSHHSELANILFMDNIIASLLPKLCCPLLR